MWQGQAAENQAPIHLLTPLFSILTLLYAGRGFARRRICACKNVTSPLQI